MGWVELGALIRVGLNDGDAVGPYRVTGELGRWPEHRLYRAVSGPQDRPFLLRQFQPITRAIEEIAPDGRALTPQEIGLVQDKEKLRLKRRAALEAERFALARNTLKHSSPYHLSFGDCITEGGVFEFFTHRNIDRINGNAAAVHITDEMALRRLITPVLAVLHELHRSEIICGSIRPEEILVDRDDTTTPVFAGLQHIYHLRGLGPQRPGRAEAGVFAPEFAERQKPLTRAADVYALSSLIFSLVRAGDDYCFGDEAARETALAGVDRVSCSLRLIDALVAGLKSDPRQRPQSLAEFEELAFGTEARAPTILLPERRRLAARPLVAQAARVVPMAKLQTLTSSNRQAASKAAGQANLVAFGAGAETNRLIQSALNRTRCITRCGAAFARRAEGWHVPAIAAIILVTVLAGLSVLYTVNPRARGAASLAAPSDSVAVGHGAHPGLAVADDLVPAAKSKLVTQDGAVQDELIGRDAQSAFRRRLVTINAEPVMLSLPPRQAMRAPAVVAGGQAAITAAQALLKRLGLYRGTVDGVMGPKTRMAILDVQETLHQEPTGEVDPQLLAALQDMKPAEVEAARAAAEKQDRQSAEQIAQAVVRPLPSFPTEAFQRRIQGWIEVAYDVDPQGSVQHARVVAFNNGRAREAFETEALAAIDHAAYVPARKNGKPVWSRGLKVRYRFDVVRHGWGPFRSREGRSSIVADSSGPSDSTLQ